MKTSSTWFWAGLLCLAAGLGCKSESTSTPAGAGQAAPSSSGPPPAAATGGSTCDVVSPAEAAGIVGLPSLEKPEVTSVPPVTMCTFSDGKRPMALVLRFETGRTLQDFALIRKGHDDHGEPTKDYPGLGDAAASFTLGPVTGITFLHKGTVIMVQGSHISLDGLGTLARKIVERRS
jgi:hypothetical protein